MKVDMTVRVVVEAVEEEGRNIARGADEKIERWGAWYRVVLLIDDKTI